MLGQHKVKTDDNTTIVIHCKGISAQIAAGPHAQIYRDCNWKVLFTEQKDGLHIKKAQQFILVSRLHQILFIFFLFYFTLIFYCTIMKFKNAAYVLLETFYSMWLGIYVHNTFWFILGSQIWVTFHLGYCK